MSPITRTPSNTRNGNSSSGLVDTPSVTTTTTPNESKLSSLSADDDARMSSSLLSDSINLSIGSPKVPPYLACTAYGERFYSFLSRDDGLEDIYMNPSYPKNSAAALAAAVFLKSGSSSGGGSNNNSSNSAAADDEHRHLDVSASEFNLPQIFPSRRAAELDALGMWQYPRPPISSSVSSTLSTGETSIDSYIRATGRRIYRDGNVTIIDIGRSAANGNSANGNEGGGADTSTNNGASSASPRKLTADVSKSNHQENLVTPRKDVGLPHLPSRWTKTDVDQTVIIDNDGTRVDYSNSSSKSSSSTLHYVAVLKTDYPIPPLTGIFYYEVEVIEHGVEEFISVGFCDIEAGLTKVPGLDSRTWGYHGDDGRISAGQSPSKNFGPKIGVGDILGCGINFSKNSIFYTKNGLPLGTAFQDVKGVLFPCIGLKTGEVIHTNFGYEEFRFDIEKYVDSMKKKVLNQIQYSKEAVDMIKEMIGEGNERDAGAADSGNDKDWGFIKDLVGSYFDHVGYLETAKAFEKERKVEEKAINFNEEVDDDSKMDVDEEDEDGNSSSNNQGEDKKELKLDILNRQRIRSYILEEDIDGALKLLNVFYPTVLEDNYLIKFKLLCRKFVSLVRKSIPEASEEVGGSSSAEGSSSASLSHRDYLNSAIQYGQDLRKEYKNDASPVITSTLSTIFSLLAYEDPYSSPELSYILSRDELIPLAEELNSAILVSQGKPAVPSLQKLAQHTTQLVWELSDQGYHTANLLNVKNDFLDG